MTEAVGVAHQSKNQVNFISLLKDHEVLNDQQENFDIKEVEDIINQFRTDS